MSEVAAAGEITQTVPGKEHKDTMSKTIHNRKQLYARLLDLLDTKSVTFITASEFRLKSIPS